MAFKTGQWRGLSNMQWQIIPLFRSSDREGSVPSDVPHRFWYILVVLGLGKVEWDHLSTLKQRKES